MQRFKKLRLFNFALLVILSIASGVAKILLLPEERNFFNQVGFNDTLIIIFGAVQLLTGLLLVLNKTRLAGASILIVTFIISTIIIFINGSFSFGLFSILPILMTVAILKEQSIEEKP